MRPDILIWIMSFTGGLLLGLFFYGGLWWTARKGLTTNHPGILFLGSMLVRTAVALAGFYFISDGQWERILVCLVGFTLARFAVLRFTKKEAAIPSPLKKVKP